jgi:hypothetical protein
MKITLHRYTLLAGLLVTFAGLATLVAPTDPDAWWHLRNGQLVLESGVPHRDVYSWTAEGRDWFVQEWLTEVVMYAVQQSLGYGALSFLFGAFQAVGAAIVYALIRLFGAGRIVSIVLLLLYMVFAAPTWGVRPQVLIPLFLGLFLLILSLYKRGALSPRALWALPAIMLLWTNMHASFFMGIALVGAFIVGEAANLYLYRPERPTPLKPLLFALAGCLVATLANPYFLELWLYPLTYVASGTDNPLHKYTQEWQSPDFHRSQNLFFAASLIAHGIVGIGRTAREGEREGAGYRWGLRARLDATHVIVFAAFTLLGLQAIRLVPIYGLIALPLLGGGLAAIWPRLGREGEGEASRGESIANAVLGVGIAAALLLFLLNSPAAQMGREPRTDTEFVYPVDAANYIADIGGPLRIYNDFGWGGYLIYRLYPQHKVFIDGRADPYREVIFDDHMILQNTAPGWREVLDKYDINLVVVSPDNPLAYALSNEDDWQAAYSDDASVVYRKGQ